MAESNSPSVKVVDGEVQVRDFQYLAENEVLVVCTTLLIRRDGIEAYILRHDSAGVMSPCEAQRVFDIATGADDFFCSLEDKERDEEG